MKTPPIDALLRHLGIAATLGHGGKWEALCPNPGHDDSSPSWVMIDRPGDRRHGSHFCQACKFGGGPWELAAAVWSIPVADAGKRLRSVFGTDEGPAAEPEDIPKVVIRDEPATPRILKMPFGVVIPGHGGRWFVPALQYLTDRGVTREQVDRWGMGYAIRGKLRNRVVMPVYDGSGNLLTFSARGIHWSMDPRYEAGKVKQGARPRRALWGEARWSGDTATIVEGVFSGLAVERAGAPNPTALLGSALTEEKALALSRFSRFIVCTDPDPAGDAVAEALSILARRAKLIRLKLDASPDDHDPETLREKIDQGLATIA